MSENWDIVDSKVLTEIKTELADLKRELKQFNDTIKVVNKTNTEIKVYLESNRLLYSKAIKDNYELMTTVKGMLEENRKLYMKAFEKEGERLNKIEKLAAESGSVDTIIRNANKKWRGVATVPSLRHTVLKDTV